MYKYNLRSSSPDGASREPLLPAAPRTTTTTSYTTTMGSPNEITTAVAGPSCTATGDDAHAAPEVEGTTAAAARTHRRIIRAIDRRIMPLLFVTYVFNFMDKTILSSAAVFGLKRDNHLQGQDYSWVSSVFYFGYFFWTYPTTLLVARLPIARVSNIRCSLCPF